MRRAAPLLVLLLAGAASAAPLPAAEDASIRAVARVRGAVVRISGLAGGVPSSGVVLAPGSIVLTWAPRAVPEDLPVSVRSPAGLAEGRVVARDGESGVVAVRLASPLAGGLAPGPWSLPVGSPVVSAGHPFGTRRADGGPAASLGIVSQVRRAAPGGPVRRYLVSTTVNPGEYGGPLADRVGRFAGILLSSRDATSGLSTAVPLDALAAAFEDRPEIAAALEGEGEEATGGWPVHDRLALVAARVAPAVVGIAAGAPGSGAPGVVCSGLVIDPEGYVVTTCRNAGKEGELRVFLPDGRELAAERLGVDDRLGIALLRVRDERPIRFAPIAGGADPEVGSFVAAVGNPNGPNPGPSHLLTVGIVGARNRSDRRYTALHTDAAVNRANEGGPLLDLEGRVIGILSTFGGEALTGVGANSGIGFAIPSDAIAPLLPALRRGERIGYHPGYLGVTLSRDPVPGGGVLIDSVQPGQPAAKAGIRPGDVILEADGKSIPDFETLKGVFVRFTDGQRVRIALRRGLRRVVVEPVLGPWPGGGPR